MKTVDLTNCKTVIHPERTVTETSESNKFSENMRNLNGKITWFPKEMYFEIS